jgi:hypothetical protein
VHQVPHDTDYYCVHLIKVPHFQDLIKEMLQGIQTAKYIVCNVNYTDFNKKPPTTDKVHSALQHKLTFSSVHRRRDKTESIALDLPKKACPARQDDERAFVTEQLSYFLCKFTLRQCIQTIG